MKYIVEEPICNHLCGLPVLVHFRMTYFDFNEILADLVILLRNENICFFSNIFSSTVFFPLVTLFSTMELVEHQCLYSVRI